MSHFLHGTFGNETSGNVPIDAFAYDDSRACLLKNPPTTMTPSPVAKPFSSLLISSKNRIDVSAAAPVGSAAWIRCNRSPSQKSSYSVVVRGNKLRFFGSAARGLMIKMRANTSVGSKNWNSMVSAGVDIMACTSSGIGNTHVLRASGPLIFACSCCMKWYIRVMKCHM